jgi:hypothetical protein
MVKFLRFLTMLKRRRGQKYFRNGSLCMPEGYLELLHERSSYV